MAYDPNVNYQQLINETSDPAQKAQYEAQRNEKIADMNKNGTNTGNYQQTNNYQQPSTYTAADAKKAAANYQAAGNYHDADVRATNAQDTAAIDAAKDRYYQAYADWKNATTPEAKAEAQARMDAAHADAEKVRAGYGYSGGSDGSLGSVMQQPDVPYPADMRGQPQLDKVGHAPDLTPYVESWADLAKQQAQLQIDYATSKGINDLTRAEEDAQKQFQTQRNQISADERNALDNQALYAEARGDKGGIGQAQYAQIQANAASNRLAVNQAQTKLSTDTARQIADLRAQGEFEKADKLLEISQQYLSQLLQLHQWAAEFNMSADQFNIQLDKWKYEFSESVREFDLNFNEGVREFDLGYDFDVHKFNYGVQQDQIENLASAGLKLAQMGITPSQSQISAMQSLYGYDANTVKTITAAALASQATGIKGSGGGTKTAKTSDGDGSWSASTNVLMNAYNALGSNPNYTTFVNWLKNNTKVSTESAIDSAWAEYQDYAKQLKGAETFYSDYIAGFGSQTAKVEATDRIKNQKGTWMTDAAYEYIMHRIGVI